MRIILLVLDSVGIGALPDAHKFGDEGSNTLGNVAQAIGGLNLPNLEAMGMANILDVAGLQAALNPSGSFGRMAEAADGKDTITGHWEMAGLIISQAFRTFPNGFPATVIDAFTERIGKGILGNVVASGTEIIEELGQQHIDTGKPIVYTSADSVFQVAAHEEVIPLAELDRICVIARELLQGEHKVGRVISRPFVGKPGAFVRTANRRDYAVEPEGPTVLDAFAQQDREVISIGKIDDIFSGRGISRGYKTDNNAHGIDTLIHLLQQGDGDFLFANLVDFDSKYGHRNDVEGYAQALEQADAGIGQMVQAMQPKDVLIVTADHGCDPTFPGSDHTREYVPLLVYGAQIKAGVDLGTRATFADVAATIADLADVPYDGPGTSFAKEVK